jgi:hypothetical protein
MAPSLQLIPVAPGKTDPLTSRLEAAGTASPAPSVRRRSSIHRLADAAAVKAIASGSQLRTITSISHRIAFSESVSAPRISATYRIGAAYR